VANIDAIDKKLLNKLQNEFPLAVNPFDIIADSMDVSTDEVLRRVESLKNSGIIRRIGAVLDASHLGYYSTLCACTVPEDKIDDFAAAVENIKNITHNYVREHELNIWFTLTTATLEQQGIIIKELEDLFGIVIKIMPAEKVYKIRVSLGMGETDEIR